MISKDDGRQVICTGCGLPLEPAPPGTYPEEQPPQYAHRTGTEAVKCPGGNARELLDSFDTADGKQLSIWFTDSTPMQVQLLADLEFVTIDSDDISLRFTDPASLLRLTGALSDAAEYLELRQFEAIAAEPE